MDNEINYLIKTGTVTLRRKTLKIPKQLIDSSFNIIFWIGFTKKIHTQWLNKVVIIIHLAQRKWVIYLTWSTWKIDLLSFPVEKARFETSHLELGIWTILHGQVIYQPIRKALWRSYRYYMNHYKMKRTMKLLTHQ